MEFVPETDDENEQKKIQIAVCSTPTLTSKTIDRTFILDRS